MNEIKKMTLKDRIHDLRLELQQIEQEFLEQCGWRNTSTAPDFVVRWVKMLPGGAEIMTNKADALRMEGITR